MAGQALVEGTGLDLELFFSLIRDLLLEHSASDLVEAVEVQVAENLLIFLGKGGIQRFKSLKLLVLGGINFRAFQSRIQSFLISFIKAVRND